MNYTSKLSVSKYFGLNKSQAELEFLDVIIDADTKLFIDPTALHLMNNEWSKECEYLIREYFRKVIIYIKQGNRRKAIAFLSALNEPNETHLGLSKEKSIGKGLGLERACKLYDSLVNSEVIKSGLLVNLEETAFMIDGIGADMISDIVTNIIREKLIEYTQEVCENYNIPTSYVSSGYILNLDEESWETKKVFLPGVEVNGRFEKLLLIPKELVRRIPSYEARRFNNNYVIPRIIEKEFNLGLGRIVNGTLKPYTKKDIKDRQHGLSVKSINRKFVLDNPQILSDYKENNRRYPLPRMNDDELVEAIMD